MTSYGFFYYLIQQVIFLVSEGVELLTKFESVGRRFPGGALRGKTVVSNSFDQFGSGDAIDLMVQGMTSAA